MNVDEFDELINTIPRVESDNSISSMDSLNVEDLRNAVERLKKIPTYQDLLKENKELKNLNRIYEEIISDDKENYKLFSSEIKQLKNQQKEFIEYLDNEIKRFEEENIYKPLQIMALETLKHISSKYKEIIGGKE